MQRNGTDDRKGRWQGPPSSAKLGHTHQPQEGFPPPWKTPAAPRKAVVLSGVWW